MTGRNYTIHLALLGLFFAQPLNAKEIGQKLSSCVLSQLEENIEFNHEHLKNKVLYIDFWASWCPPCAKSFPFLNKLHMQYQEQGLEVIGINMDEKPEDADKFLKKFPADFNVTFNFNKQCAKELGVAAMPSSYLIDRQGTIHYIHLGFRSGQEAELRQQVEQLISKTTTIN